MSNAYNIHERIFQFVVDVINFLNKLPKTSTNLIFINQCTRSVTSIGANDQEADGSTSKMDFIHNYTITRKEAKETIFWIKIINNTNKIRVNEGEKLIQEGNEIVAIISTIIKNASLSSNKRK